MLNYFLGEQGEKCKNSDKLLSLKSQQVTNFNGRFTRYKMKCEVEIQKAEEEERCCKNKKRLPVRKLQADMLTK